MVKEGKFLPCFHNNADKFLLKTPLTPRAGEDHAPYIAPYMHHMFTVGHCGTQECFIS